MEAAPPPFAQPPIVADRPQAGLRPRDESRATSAELSAAGHRTKRADWALVAILLAAWVLRVVGIALWPNIQWPDEIYQALEPAHRLVFGYGIVSWEWQAGIRSLVLPSFFAAPMEMARWLGAGASFYLAVIAALLCALSLSVVWTAYRLGGDLASGSGRRFGAIAAAAPAVLWLELILFAPHALADVIAAHLLLPGLYLVQRQALVAAKQKTETRRDIAAGALVGLATALRPNLGLPLLLALGVTVKADRRRWLGLLIGALPMLAAYGAIDLFQGQWPLQSTLRFLEANLVAGDSSAFGVAPWNYYSSLIVLHWGGALPFLVLLLFLGARGNALWLVMAIGLFLELSLVPHKEYRFLYPAIACLMPVLGIGTARLAAAVAAIWTRPHSHAAILRITWLVTAACSAALAQQPAFADEWFRSAAALRAFAALRADPAVCGVGLLDGVPLTYMPGYVSLHRDIPLRDKVTDAKAVAAELSDLLANDLRSDLPQGYVLDRCWKGTLGGLGGPAMVCRYHRPGPCAPAQAG